MGTKIWLYPDPGGTVEEIDFGETLSDLQFNPLPNQTITEGMTGALSQTQYNSRGVVRVVHERFTSAALARDLYAVETHLKNGGLIAIAVDAQQAWAGFLERVPDRGDTAITLSAFNFPYAAPTMLDGEEVEVMGAQPYATREFVTISGITSGLSATLAEGLRFSLVSEGSRWAFARHRGFWPLLRLPKESRTSPIVTHDHRISYTFDVELEEAIDVFEAMGGAVDAVVDTTTVTDAGFTVEEVNLNRFNPGAYSGPGGPGGSGGGPAIPGNLPGLSDLFS